MLRHYLKHQFSKSRPNLSKENWIMTGSTNAQRCFLLSRANQLSFIIEGDRFFDEKPSLQTLVDDPTPSSGTRSPASGRTRATFSWPSSTTSPTCTTRQMRRRCAALSLSLAACVSPRCVHPHSPLAACTLTGARLSPSPSLRASPLAACTLPVPTAPCTQCRRGIPSPAHSLLC